MSTWLEPRAEIFWKPGGIGSVPNTLWMYRGTYNQLVHLGHGSALYAENVISPGQSGDYRSPHFADQLQLYATWTYKPMRLTKWDQLKHAESVTRLQVPLGRDDHCHRLGGALVLGSGPLPVAPSEREQDRRLPLPPGGGRPGLTPRTAPG